MFAEMNEENDIKFHDLNYTAERGILKKGLLRLDLELSFDFQGISRSQFRSMC